ncbi:MAG TPA: DUF2288 domain-containing protein [Gallionella sp.]|nr:DUF2288 domain-containing protein [Gallionella sp.]
MTTHNLQELYRAKLNNETARIPWKELQRFFASGATLAVSAELDLVEVAFHISEDNQAQVIQWVNVGLLNKVTDAQALEWYDADAEVWAVVVSPYVLVQSIERNLQ